MILLPFQKSPSVPGHRSPWEQLYVLLEREGVRFTLETERADLLRGLFPNWRRLVGVWWVWIRN